MSTWRYILVPCSPLGMLPWVVVDDSQTTCNKIALKKNEKWELLYGFWKKYTTYNVFYLTESNAVIFGVLPCIWGLLPWWWLQVMKTILMLKLHLIEYKKAHRGYSRLRLDIYMVHVLNYIPFVVFEYMNTTLATKNEILRFSWVFLLCKKKSSSAKLALISLFWWSYKVKLSSINQGRLGAA